MAKIPDIVRVPIVFDELAQRFKFWHALLQEKHRDEVYEEEVCATEINSVFEVLPRPTLVEHVPVVALHRLETCWGGASDAMRLNHEILARVATTALEVRLARMALHHGHCTATHGIKLGRRLVVW